MAAIGLVVLAWLVLHTDIFLEDNFILLVLCFWSLFIYVGGKETFILIIPIILILHSRREETHNIIGIEDAERTAVYG